MKYFVSEMPSGENAWGAFARLDVNFPNEVKEKTIEWTATVSRV